MFNPSLCMYEVWKVAETHRKTDYPSCDIGTAFSMFMADVKLGQSTDGNTGGILPDFDFAAARAAWDAMTPKEQSAALEQAGDVRVNLYDTLCERHPDKNAMVAAVENYLADNPVVETAPPYLYGVAWDIWDRADKDGTDLATARDAYLAADETWADFDDAKKAQEIEWFDINVVNYDKGLKYARSISDRGLFETILATR